jgi:hypothetical protein
MWVHDKFETLSLPPDADNEVPLVSEVCADSCTHGDCVAPALPHTCHRTVSNGLLASPLNPGTSAK